MIEELIEVLLNKVIEWVKDNKEIEEFSGERKIAFVGYNSLINYLKELKG